MTIVSQLCIIFCKLKIHQWRNVSFISQPHRNSLEHIQPHYFPFPQSLQGWLSGTPFLPSAERRQECISHCGMRVKYIISLAGRNEVKVIVEEAVRILADVFRIYTSHFFLTLSLLSMRDAYVWLVGSTTLSLSSLSLHCEAFCGLSPTLPQGSQ